MLLGAARRGDAVEADPNEGGVANSVTMEPHTGEIGTEQERREARRRRPLPWSKRRRRARVWGTPLIYVREHNLPTSGPAERPARPQAQVGCVFRFLVLFQLIFSIGATKTHRKIRIILSVDQTPDREMYLSCRFPNYSVGSRSLTEKLVISLSVGDKPTGTF